MLRDLEVAKDGWDKLGRDLDGALAKIREHIRVFELSNIEYECLYS